MRHRATARIWLWLEEGQGKEKSLKEVTSLRVIIEELDDALYRLDAEHFYKEHSENLYKGWPVPAGFAEEYATAIKTAVIPPEPDPRLVSWQTRTGSQLT